MDTKNAIPAGDDEVRSRYLLGFIVGFLAGALGGVVWVNLFFERLGEMWFVTGLLIVSGMLAILSARPINGRAGLHAGELCIVLFMLNLLFIGFEWMLVF